MCVLKEGLAVSDLIVMLCQRWLHTDDDDDACITYWWCMCMCISRLAVQTHTHTLPYTRMEQILYKKDGWHDNKTEVPFLYCPLEAGCIILHVSGWDMGRTKKSKYRCFSNMVSVSLGFKNGAKHHDWQLVEQILPPNEITSTIWQWLYLRYFGFIFTKWKEVETGSASLYRVYDVDTGEITLPVQEIIFWHIFEHYSVLISNLSVWVRHKLRVLTFNKYHQHLITIVFTDFLLHMVLFVM